MNRELKQTTTTATRTSLNKRFILMSRTVAVHVRYKSLYISLPSSAKQQREMTNLVPEAFLRREPLLLFFFLLARRAESREKKASGRDRWEPHFHAISF